MASRPLEDREEFEVKCLEELHAWLAENHKRPEGVWLIHHKKASPHYLAMGDIVDECLCWGWVDSLSRGKDDLRTMHWIAPRKAGSNWSRVNKDKIARLQDAGRLQAAGIAMVEAAQNDGTWTALDDVENLVVPDDLAAAFDARPGSRAAWDDFPRSVKRGVLEWIFTAKTPPTRAKRIADTADKAAKGERANQWKS